MKHTLALLIALLSPTLARNISAGQDEASPTELLEQAIFTEETVGDLAGAIEIYRQIVEQTESYRTPAAQAQYRLGLCYLKLGEEDEGAAALRRLFEEYPGEVELVSLARARLTEMGRPLPGTAGSVIRKVWEGGNGYSRRGSVSADGRWMTLRERGRLTLHDLETGESVRLTDEPDFGWGAWASAISPDGRRVAFAWWVNEVTALRVVGVEGGEPRELVSGEITELEAQGWTPDGAHVLATWRRADGVHVVALVALADGSVDTLAELGGGPPGGASPSPDGRYVAYDRATAGGASQHDVFLLSVETGDELPLVEHAASDTRPIWSPDGSGVLFLSDRGGSTGIWWIAVENGRPAGRARLVKPDTGAILPKRFGSDGSFHYGVLNAIRDVHRVAFDPASGKIAGEPELVSERFVGRNTSPTWSPDGRQLAFLSLRHPGRDRVGRWTVVVRDVATGDERVATPELFLDEEYSPRWRPDGRIVVTGFDMDGRQGFYAVDLDTGASAPVVQAEFGQYVEELDLSPDGRTAFYDHHDPEQEHVCVLRSKDLETGEVRELVRPGVHLGVNVLAVSPDGSEVAFLSNDASIQLIAPVGGEPREVFRTDAPEFVSGFGHLTWVPGGNALLCAIGRERSAARSVWRIPTDGGEPGEIGLRMDDIRRLTLHPDGRRLAFDVGTETTQIWVIENFDEMLAEARRRDG